MAKQGKAERLGSPDWVLIGATAALISIGLMMVYSATFDIGYRGEGDAAHYIKRQIMWLGVGVILMFVASQIHYRHLMKLSIPLMLATLIMLLVLAVTQKRLLAGRSVSPAELAKLTMIIYMSHWLASKRAEQLRRLPVGALPFTIIVGLIAGLVLVQPDISEALVIVTVCIAMFFLAGADLFQFSVGILGGGAAFALVVTRIPYAIERLQPYLDSWRQPLESANFQLRQGLIALGSGGLLGLGPGNGRMKYLWLPAAHTDSIFALVGEELGLLGCLALVGLYGLIIYRGLRISRQATDPFGSMLAIGVSCWIGIQALINMAVVTGTIPFAGIALPFISVGGSSLVTCMIGIGILLSVSRAAVPITSRAEMYATRTISSQQTSSPETGTLR